MSLYNVVARRNLLLAQLAELDGELSPELEEQLTVTDERLQESALELLGLRETAQTNILGAEAEIERLRGFIQSNQRAVERIESNLKAATLRLGTIHAGSFRLTTRPSVAVVLADDFTASIYTGKWVEPTEGYYKPDRVAIRKFLEAGKQLDGATLEQRVNLQIK